MDILLNQRVIYATKREDCIKKIRELGALPQEAFDRVSSRIWLAPNTLLLP
jgi:hypothetical protein